MSKFMTHISPLTHMVSESGWYKGPGFYVCIEPQEWDGPFVDEQAARQEHGNILCHTPARGSRSSR